MKAKGLTTQFNRKKNKKVETKTNLKNEAKPKSKISKNKIKIQKIWAFFQLYLETQVR